MLEIFCCNQNTAGQCDTPQLFTSLLYSACYKWG